MTEQAHPIATLHDAVSGRLTAAERATLDAHLASCDACRQEFEAMLWLSKQTAAAADALAPPVDLDASLLRALDAEDAATARSSSRPALSRRAWLTLGGAAAAAAVAAVIVGRRDEGDEAVPAAAAADLRAHVAGALPLPLPVREPAVLAARMNAAAPGFVSDVYDFAMMAYRLDGGGIHTLAGHTTTMAAYRGAGTQRLVCQMYPGRLEDLPAPDRRHTTGGVEFFVYDEDGIPVVAWRSGPLVCVLASNSDPETALSLAIAKAVPI